ncbi:MAG TPA: FtsX-like permease family protein [Planctomycetota bacterium]|nr:FtsX-like permease family protein [Planctomycetota bacterium]
MPSPLRLTLRTLLSHWPRHRLQCALCLLGITLGVAVVTAMDLANASALASFRESLASVSGRATHQIAPQEGSFQNGVPEELFAKVYAVPGVIAAAPVIETYGTLVLDPKAALPNSPIDARNATAAGKPPLQALVRILGVEPLLDQPFRSIASGTERELRSTSGGVQMSLGADVFNQWVLRDDGCALSEALAARLGVKSGDTLTLIQSGKRHTLKLLATYRLEQKLAQDDILLIDIAAAQERFGTLGKLSSIDLILPDGQDVERSSRSVPTGAEDERSGSFVLQNLRALLPRGVVLQRSGERAGRTEALLSAFQLNLTALSLLALVVGMFLVYNTLTVAVLQRMPMIGTLRCLGASEKTTRRAVLLEAMLLGCVGSVLGLLAGAALARVFLERVGGIMTDLYAHVGALAVFYDPLAAIKGVALGMLASIAGAYVPALEAGRTAPTSILRRSRSEAWAERSWKKLLIAGLLSCAVAAVLAALPGKSPVPGLFAAFALAMGGALSAPAVTRWISLYAAAPLRRAFGVKGMLAARGLGANLSRTGLAVGALGMALSMTVGVALMIASFRGTLDRWMGQSLMADIYLRPAVPASLRSTAHIPADVLERLRAIPGVEAVDTFRGRDVALDDGSLILIAATDTRVTFTRGRENFPITSDGGDPERSYRGLLDGQILISEPMARKQNLKLGDTLTLPGTTRPVALKIEGIYYEYATDRGVVSMDAKTYADLFGESAPQSASLYLKPGADLSAAMQELRDEIGAPFGMYIFSNRTLRDEAFRVFDRTFAITGQLENLSLAVGLCGIVSALLALLRERAADFGLLRALGLTARGLFALVLLEGLLLGTAALLVAWVLGPALAVLLIKVINVRAFGWTILFSMKWEVFARAGAMALLMSAAAALYPAWRGRGINAAGALREE